MRTTLLLNLAAIDASALAVGIVGRESILAYLGVRAFEPVTPHLLASIHNLLGLELGSLCTVVRCDPTQSLAA